MGWSFTTLCTLSVTLIHVLARKIWMKSSNTRLIVDIGFVSLSRYTEVAIKSNACMLFGKWSEMELYQTMHFLGLFVHVLARKLWMKLSDALIVDILVKYTEAAQRMRWRFLALLHGLPRSRSVYSMARARRLFIVLSHCNWN